MHIFVCFILTLCLKSLQWLLFFNQFVRFTLFDGQFSTLRSTMELQVPGGFLKRPALKVFETTSKSQHRKLQSKSRCYWKFKIAVFLMFDIWELQHKNGSLMYIFISHRMFVYHWIASVGNSTNGWLIFF